MECTKAKTKEPTDGSKWVDRYKTEEFYVDIRNLYKFDKNNVMANEAHNMSVILFKIGCSCYTTLRIRTTN